jgi:hypothetical protein
MLQMMWYVIFLISGKPLTIKETKVLHTMAWYVSNILEIAYAILTRWVTWHFALDFT